MIYILNKSLYFQEGSWVKGEKEGYGILKFADGNLYKGFFVNGNMEGKGEFSFTSGD